MELQIEINAAQKIRDAVMADCGTHYFSTYEYRLEGDAELYGVDEWRIGKIIWNTTEAWRAEEERVKRVKRDMEENPDGRVDTGLLEDESMACDWDAFEVQDDNGDLMPEATAKEVVALLP